MVRVLAIIGMLVQALAPAACCCGADWCAVPPERAAPPGCCNTKEKAKPTRTVVRLSCAPSFLCCCCEPAGVVLPTGPVLHAAGGYDTLHDASLALPGELSGAPQTVLESANTSFVAPTSHNARQARLSVWLK